MRRALLWTMSAYAVLAIWGEYTVLMWPGVLSAPPPEMFLAAGAKDPAPK